jgi:hypothetical protein
MSSGEQEYMYDDSEEEGVEDDSDEGDFDFEDADVAGALRKVTGCCLCT